MAAATADFCMKAEVKQWAGDDRFFRSRPICFNGRNNRSHSSNLVRE
jgi:hypothetical protein